MSLGTIALPQLDGTRPTTDARLSAWLGRHHSKVLDDAMDTARYEVDELADLAGSRTKLTDRVMQASEHRDRGRGALEVMANLLPGFGLW